MTLVESDCPLRRRPCTDEYAPRGQVLKMPEEGAADPEMLVTWKNIRVADQVHVSDVLDTHYSDQFLVGLVTGKDHTGGDLALEFL